MNQTKYYTLERLGQVEVSDKERLNLPQNFQPKVCVIGIGF